MFRILHFLLTTYRYLRLKDRIWTQFKDAIGKRKWTRAKILLKRLDRVKKAYYRKKVKLQ